MSNYSVKLTKCGKCQFSLAHLPSGGGEREADLGAAGPGLGPCGAGHLGPPAPGPGQGQRALGWTAGGCRAGPPGLGVPSRAGAMLQLGPREGWEPAP